MFQTKQKSIPTSALTREHRSRELKAESREQRAESWEQRVERREHRTESGEQRAAEIS
jgi:hypothetical protein